MTSFGLRYRFRASCVVLAAVMALASMSFAQSSGTCTIGGRVIDPSGAAIPLAAVTVTNTATGASRMLQTDSTGTYRAALLPPGNYNITVMQEGFGTLKRTGVNVEVGVTATIDMQLLLANVTSVVTVTEEAPLTNPEKIGVNTSISQDEIENLPINGRRWDNFVLLTPV